MQFFGQCPYQNLVLWISAHTDSKIPLIHSFEVRARSNDNSMLNNEPSPELITLSRFRDYHKQEIRFARKDFKSERLERVRQPVALAFIDVAGGRY